MVSPDYIPERHHDAIVSDAITFDAIAFARRAGGRPGGILTAPRGCES
jgi:hypothetical protein